MEKIFDHSRPYRGWTVVDNAESVIRGMFAEERYLDRDGGLMWFIEAWDSSTDAITYWVGDFGGWWNTDSPSLDIDICKTIEHLRDCIDEDPTKLDPRRDYILI